eukprot:15365206-Ditylum_brightwellii.AAC.1
MATHLLKNQVDCGNITQEQHLKKYYDISIKWEGKNYCRISFDWKYNLGYIYVSMSSYIPKALDKFQHKAPIYLQHCPYQWNRPIYGKKVQYAKLSNTSPYLDAKETKQLQSIVGTFLYYSRAIDGPALPALNDINTQQSTPTQATITDTKWIMDFFHTYPNTWLHFFARDM